MAQAVVGAVPDTNRIPTSFTTTHDTDGLPGWGALDWFRPAGTIVGAPASGTIERTGGSAGSRGTGIYGRNAYLKTDSGQRIFMTHFSDLFVRGRQRVEAGQPLGRVAPYGNASHIHVAVQGAPDRGGKVQLNNEGGGGVTGAVSGAVGGAVDAVTGAPGAAKDAVSGAVDKLNPFDDIAGWASEYGVRGFQIAAGFVLVLVGLVLLGKQLGVPVGGAMSARRMGTQ